MLPMMLRHSLFFAATFGLAAALVASPCAAVLDNWTDENGRLVYGDRPPAGARSERLNASVPPADPNAVRDMANKDADIKKRQQQREDDAAKIEKEQADERKRLDQCTQTRSRIKTLRDDIAVFRYNEKGEKVYFQPADRERAIGDSEKTLRELN